MKRERLPAALTYPCCFLAGVLCWLLIYAVWAMATGCRAPSSPLPPSGPAALLALPQRDLGEALKAPSRRLSLILTDVVPPVAGLIRAVHGNTACRPVGEVNPYVHLPHYMPEAGRQLEVLFVTRHGGNAPTETAWLLWSFEEIDAPIDFTPFGMPGCMLLVRAENITTIPSQLLQQDGGLIRFSWLCPTWSAGTHFWMQLLVFAPGQTTSGYLSSHAVEVIVGSAR
jgi:hypothetical protein